MRRWPLRPARGRAVFQLFDKSETVFDDSNSENQRLVAKTYLEVFESEIIFFAVPISEFEKTIKETKKYFQLTKEGEILATKFYDERAKEIFGEFAILNFKD